MPTYTITDTGKVLTLKLKTNFSYAKYLDFKKNGVSVSQRESSWNSTTKEHTWNIQLRTWRKGDVLSDFTISTGTGSYDIGDMNEPIVWYLDDVEVQSSHSKVYNATFDDVGEHTLQAVWSGNQKYATAMTPLTHFYVKPIDGSTAQSEIYTISFLNLDVNTFKYGQEGSKVTARLLKGGIAQGGESVTLTSNRDGYTYTGTTDNNGEVDLYLRDLPVGNHTIFAEYTSDDLVQCSCQMKIKVEKNDPIIGYVRQNNSGQSTGWHISDEVIVRWQEPDGKSMNDRFLPLYINGKLYNVQTNTNGRAWIRLTNTGTYRFKATYQGDMNINPYELEWTIVVS